MAKSGNSDHLMATHIYTEFPCTVNSCKKKTFFPLDKHSGKEYYLEPDTSYRFN